MKAPRKFRRAAIDAGPDGFFHAMDRHFAVHYRRSDMLVVSFDNLNSRDAPIPRYPWGYGFLRELGYSHLALMMTRRNDWFRHGDVDRFFERLRDEGFFAGFRRVVFYGSSMGGYGTLAYCHAAPGADVVAFCPQTTLDRRLVPWEHRYARARQRGDWSSATSDAAVCARSAHRISIFLDPQFEPDARQVARLDPDNLTLYPCRWMGHKVPRYLKHMGLLKPMAAQALAGTLTPERFRAMLCGGRGNRSHARLVLKTALARGHPGLVEAALDSLATTRPDWNFPQLRTALAAQDRGDEA